MQNQKLIEKLILSAQSDQELFSVLNKFSDDEASKKEVYQELIAVMKASSIICDNLRSSNNVSFKNFKKLLNNDFSFSNENVFKKLYSYGMFASR